MIALKEFQKNKIDDIVKAVSDLLHIEGENRVCVFQSPTGSGKTVMVAKFIEQIIKDLPEEDMSFLWVSIGKGDLHKQSKKSLDSIFSGFPSCVLVENEFLGSRNIIERNEVVVVNWEKLRSKDRESGDWKNKIMRDGEGVNFVEVLQATKEVRRIILVIDESHYSSDTERTNELRQIVNADVTLEMSATPKILPTPQEMSRGTAKYIIVEPKDVIEQGMIKKEITINDGIASLVSDEKTSQDIILEAAYKKRLEIKKTFEDLEININPLCLIQLPNAEAGQAKKEIIETYLASKGITETNNKLAVWLSEDKSEILDEISQKDNSVEFLIFKQAIDTGWDCPRAHILVKLREIQSYTFEVQTVGRILRMPEQIHYENEILNKGYIYTNLESIVVKKEEYNPNIIKHLKSIRRDVYKEINLQSYYKSRVDYGDITSSFYKVLEKTFCDGLGIKHNPDLVNISKNTEAMKKKGMSVSATVYQDGLITDKTFSMEEFDKLHGRISEASETVYATLADNDIYDVFNQIIKENLNGFAPKRSIPTVRESIYIWFRNYLGINPRSENGATTIQMLFLHDQNRAIFTQLLSQATGEYKPIKKDEVKKKIDEIEYSWNISKDAYFNQHTDEKVDCDLYIYKPCYLSASRLRPEREFESHLETMKDKVLWWYKNGESNKDYFGIKYTENQMPQTFYPDYIVQYKSGSIGIFDTKKGSTAKEATPKATALQLYIKENSKKGKNLVGGIVIKDNTGQWRIHQKENYSYDLNDLREWEYFDTIK
jgi:type III restriction enzyme